MMRTPHKAGYGVLTSPHAPTRELDTCTCKHCNRVFVVRSSAPAIPAEVGGWCGLCARMICGRCAGKPCVPFERQLEQMEARGRLLRQVEA